MPSEFGVRFEPHLSPQVRVGGRCKFISGRWPVQVCFIEGSWMCAASIPVASTQQANPPTLARLFQVRLPRRPSAYWKAFPTPDANCQKENETKFPTAGPSELFEIHLVISRSLVIYFLLHWCLVGPPGDSTFKQHGLCMYCTFHRGRSPLLAYDRGRSPRIRGGWDGSIMASSWEINNSYGRRRETLACRRE